MGPDRGDRLGQPAQSIAAHDQNVSHAAVAQLSHHLGPKSGAFGLLDPHAQHSFAALHVDPDDQMTGLDPDRAAVTDP